MILSSVIGPQSPPEQHRGGYQSWAMFGTDKLEEANAAYEIAVANNPDRVVLVLDGTRIMRKSGP